ncbi:hypothetical protein RJ639_036451, partial [Escallonia herrerae]
MTCFPFLFSRGVTSAGRKFGEFDEEFSGIHNVVLYSYKELQAATNDFSPANKIGEGGFGSVFKGRLRNGKVAAVKVLSAESRQGAPEFVTEVKVISDIEHENLVKLYGCCVQDNHRILVYQFLENNSLAQTLLGGGHSSIQGYLAPEYAIRGQLTRKADVYSFGVLLLEIVSGRCNTNARLPIEEQYILERTWQLYERRELVALVDTSLDGHFDAEEACNFLKIGLLCTQDNAKLRPSMSNVVKMLRGEKKYDGDTITKPGIISDFMDLKIGSNPKAEPDTNYTSSGSDNLTVSSGMSSQPTMTFTAYGIGPF